MLDCNTIQNKIIDRRNRTIQTLEDRINEEKEFLAAFLKTIPKMEWKK